MAEYVAIGFYGSFDSNSICIGLIGGDMTSEEKIQELKNYNPTVYKALAMMKSGFSYEEALEIAVIALAEELKISQQLRQQYQYKLKRSYRQNVVVKNAVRLLSKKK